MNNKLFLSLVDELQFVLQMDILESCSGLKEMHFVLIKVGGNQGQLYKWTEHSILPNIIT